VDVSNAFNSFTAVLIVACPCALSLAIPFTYGNLLRLAGSLGFYIKNVEVIERVQQSDLVIFDKTGTITDYKKIQLHWKGNDLSTHQKVLIKSIAFQSNHPLSKSIFLAINDIDTLQPNTFEEIPGGGLTGSFGSNFVRIGSHAFIFGKNEQMDEKGIFVEINHVNIGYFEVFHQYRAGVYKILRTLSEIFAVHILSGDHIREKQRLLLDFPFLSKMKFQQSPLDKLNHIKEEQKKGHQIIMIGDGLNDAGALKQANVGIVISDQSNNFTPACDIIVDAGKFEKLLSFLLLLKKTKILIIGAFILALCYNIIGLWFAVQGLLSPVVAAILMPLSSISVMSFGMISSYLLFRNYLNK
jgi:Cu+-exporting ATPase